MRHALLLASVTTLFISASALVPSARDVRALELGPRHLSDLDDSLSSTDRAPGLHRRKKDCIDLRGSIGPSDCTAARKTNGFRGAFDQSGKKDRPTKDTVIRKDAVAKEIPESQMTKGDFTCDHILELNILKAVINLPGGVCDEADKIVDPVEAKARLQKIRDVVNRPENLVSFRSTIENIKTRNTQRFNAEKEKLPGTPPGKIKLPGTPLTSLVMVDYLRQTRSKTQETARLLDAEITKQFGAGTTTGVASLWDDYLLYTQKRAVIKELELRQQIEDKKKKAQEDAAWVRSIWVQSSLVDSKRGMREMIKQPEPDVAYGPRVGNGSRNLRARWKVLELQSRNGVMKVIADSGEASSSGNVRTEPFAMEAREALI